MKEHTRHFTPTELLDREIKPPKLLMTGEPGSGKSYTIDTICELASVMKVGVVATTSYNGIAPVNIDGNTIAKMFAIHKATEAQRFCSLMTKQRNYEADWTWKMFA